MCVCDVARKLSSGNTAPVYIQLYRGNVSVVLDHSILSAVWETEKAVLI